MQYGQIVFLLFIVLLLYYAVLIVLDIQKTKAAQAAEQEASEVVSENVNNLTIFQMRNQGTENRLMSPGTTCYHNETCTFYRFCDISCNQVKMGSSGALKTIFVALYTIQQNTCFINVF